MLNAQARSWLRAGFGASALVAAGSAGFLSAAHPRAAAADGLLPTTVAVPSLPVTVPVVSLPLGTTTTTTTATTTTAPTTSTTTHTVTSTPAPAAPAATSAGGAVGTADVVTATTAGVNATDAATTVAGSLRLPGGSISIPVASVVAPNRLRLAVTLAPRTTRIVRPVTARIQVRDAGGRLVRGAAVAIRSMPGGMLQPLAQRRSAPDGRASFVVRGKARALGTSNRLWLLVTAADPARPKAVSVSRLVAVTFTAHSNG